MKSSDKVRGKTGSAQRRKPAAPKRQNAPKVSDLGVSLSEKTDPTVLIRERDEALEQLKAAAEVLRVIASSSKDVKPVFEAIVESACKLCGAADAYLALKDGDDLVFQAQHGPIPIAWKRRPINRQWPAGRAVVDGKSVHLRDILAREGDEFPDGREIARQDGARTALTVPLMREGESIGVIILRRTEVQPFTDKQIALLKTFADQAVIAIENARLFDEVQTKTRDLEESLQQQTATSEVLQIISSSPGDLAPVFDKMLENATRVCGAEFGSMYLVEDDSLRQAALYNVPAALAAARANKVFRPHPQGHLAAAIRTKQAIQVADVRTTAAYLERIPYSIELAELGGARTLAIVPMLREDEVIGAITIYRQEVRPFADKQIELVSNFAKQAVIAIENARLLTETREALERQTATAEILKVINSSPADLGPVFDVILQKARALCGIAHGSLQLFDGKFIRAVAVHGVEERFAQRLRQRRPLAESPAVQAFLQGERHFQIDDARNANVAILRSSAELTGSRTVLNVPLRREGQLLGTIVSTRREIKPFTEKEISLFESFAAQAVIAIENARLLNELRESLQQQTATADVLKVISRSTVDLETVLDTLVETVMHLCRADQAVMFRRRDDKYHLVAARGLSAEGKAR